MMGKGQEGNNGGGGVENVLANIDLARSNIDKSLNVKTVVLVTGSAWDKDRWQERLDKSSPYIFNRDNSTSVTILEEKIGPKTREGNFLGTILAYSRLKNEAKKLKKDIRSSVSLMGMMFGRGERVSPFTQIEGNSKPAIVSYGTGAGGENVPSDITEMEEALTFFMPVAKYLEDGGFRGVLNKWGDETEIPSLNLASPVAKGSFGTFDIIKFVSALEVTEDLAREKDWVVYGPGGDMIDQISRASKEEIIERFRGKDIEDERAGEYRAGVSLGPVAVSYDTLDIMEEVFGGDIRKDGVFLDFDPYVLMAFASKGDARKWEEALKRDPKLKKIAGPGGTVPDLFSKVNKVREVFRKKYGRDLNLKVMDLGSDIYWSDIGQHKAMREKYMALNDKGARGAITRKIEGIDDARDGNGNVIARSEIGPDVVIKDSVVVDSVITGKSRIEGSVVKGSRLNDTEMTEAFFVLSFRLGRTILHAKSGLYQSIGGPGDILILEEGMRHGTLCTLEGPVDMRVSEDTDLRDKTNNYDRPVFGNTLSFREAYDVMRGVSSRELDKRRRKLIEDCNKTH